MRGRAADQIAALGAAFHDPQHFGRLHRIVLGCRPEGPPQVDLLAPEALADARSISVLPGSFNPLTTAHVALADAAIAAGLGPVAFALSTLTVDKGWIEGAWLEDRLLVLELHAGRRPGRAAALLNRGLYVDQAAAFRTRLPTLERLTFLVGFDKIVQIFDPRYYLDRDAALHKLFGSASFVVAPRAGAGQDELMALLQRPENRPFAAAVQPIELAAELGEVASSEIRGALAGGQTPPRNLPPESLAFIQATGCYEQPVRGSDGRLRDRYAEGRAALLRWVAQP